MSLLFVVFNAYLFAAAPPLALLDERDLREQVEYAVNRSANATDTIEDPEFVALIEGIESHGDEVFPVLREIILTTNDRRVFRVAVGLMHGSGWEQRKEERNMLLRDILYGNVEALGIEWEEAAIHTLRTLEYSAGPNEAQWIVPFVNNPVHKVAAYALSAVRATGNSQTAAMLEAEIAERAEGLSEEEQERDVILYRTPAALEEMRARGGNMSGPRDDQPVRETVAQGEVQQSIADEAATMRSTVPDVEIAQTRRAQYWPYLLGGVLALLAGFVVFTRSRRS